MIRQPPESSSSTLAVATSSQPSDAEVELRFCYETLAYMASRSFVDRPHDDKKLVLNSAVELYRSMIPGLSRQAIDGAIAKYQGPDGEPTVYLYARILLEAGFASFVLAVRICYSDDPAS